MDQLNQISIEERATTYDVKLTYHSDIKCQNYDVSIVGIEEPNGRVTLTPGSGTVWEKEFMFNHSDPDRVIAIAQMIMSFAQMVKNENKKRIDTSSETC